MRRPLRALLLALLSMPALAGCLGGADDGEPRLAQPTDAPIVVPVPPRPVTPSVVVDFADPGYVMNGSWRVGDAWDYESNRSRYLRMRVVDARTVGDATHFLLEERSGVVGNPPSGVSRTWIEGGNWTRLNATDSAGIVTLYEPGVPQRYLRNGSFTYNETVFLRDGRVSSERGVGVASRVTDVETILFPWGYVEATQVEHRIISQPANGTSQRLLITYWVHRDYLGPVAYEVDDLKGAQERFRLMAARVGDMRRGTLAAP